MPDNKKLMLVTGAGGRIGRAVVNRFSKEYKVIGFDRHKDEQIENMEHVTMDISSDESVGKAMQEVRERFGTDVGPVIHLAAYYSFGGGDPSLYDKITVKGTHRLLQELKLFNSVEMFLFSSTLLVHKPCELGETINENWPLEPKWDYPKSKVKTEELIDRERGDYSSVILRIAGCYDDKCHSIPLAHNIQRVYQHELASHFFPGNIKHGNPFVHMDDVVDAIELSVRKRESLGKETILNIGEDDTMSYGEIQEVISQTLEHKDFHVYRIPKWMAKEGAWVEDHLPFVDDKFVQPWMVDIADDHYALDISRAKELIGWTPKHYLRKSLPLMMELLKTNPLEWYKNNQLKAPKWLEQKVAEKAHAK